MSKHNRHVIEYITAPQETAMTDRTPHDPQTPQQPGRRRAIQQAASVGVLAATPQWVASAFAQGDDLAPYRSAKINWKQVEGESITVAVIPASYFENLIVAAAAVRGADRRQGALREGAAGPDPPEGDARPVVEDGDLRHARGRPDVLPAVRRQQVGRAARQVPERRHAHRRRPGSTTTTSSRPGATPIRSTASPTASPTTAR